MEVLETKRLILRDLRPQDIADFYAYAKDPAVGLPAGWKPHESLEESRAVLACLIREQELWALEDRETGRVIGSVGLHQDRRRQNGDVRMLGYVLAQGYWGRGLMPEAVQRVLAYGFERMELQLVSVCHYPFNGRSRRVIEKCGFVYEGTLRRAFRRFDGVVLDEICHSITREEYLAAFAGQKAFFDQRQRKDPLEKPSPRRA